MIDVSIVIPTRNRGEMLRRAINSVRSQNVHDWELIVVSDGSTDDTETIVSSFRDSRIRFIHHNTPRGASAARNTRVKAERGKYIEFLDDEDE